MNVLVTYNIDYMGINQKGSHYIRKVDIVILEALVDGGVANTIKKLTQRADKIAKEEEGGFLLRIASVTVYQA